MSRLFEVRTIVEAENAKQAVALARNERVFYVTDPHNKSAGEETVIQEPPAKQKEGANS